MAAFPSICVHKTMEDWIISELKKKNQKIKKKKKETEKEKEKYPFPFMVYGLGSTPIQTGHSCKDHMLGGRNVQQETKRI